MTTNLTIDGVSCAFTPIKVFRRAHDLPDSFGIAHFEPKDYEGLGRIDRAGAELNTVRAATLASVRQTSDTAKRTPFGWLDAAPTLQTQFERELVQINEVVGLRPVEIEFAAAGFGDVCRAYAYAKLRMPKETPNFHQVYGEWLDSTVRVSSTVHAYDHHGSEWHIQIVTHAYGRAGLIIRRGSDIDYVADAGIGCPAEGYMMTLLEDVTALMAG